MENLLSSWVLSVLGVVLVSLLVEIILPNGKISKIVKSILSIFSIFVIISPIKKLINQIDFNLISKEIVIDENFLENRDNEKLRIYKEEIKKNLDASGFLNVNIDFDTVFENKETTIKSVFVDLCDLVLTDKKLNIDKYTNITAIIKNIISIKEEQIIFYEWNNWDSGRKNQKEKFF